MTSIRILFLFLLIGLGPRLALAQEAPISADEVLALIEGLEGPPPGKKTPIPEGDDYKRDQAYKKLRQYDLLPYWLAREKEMRLQVGEGQPPTIRVQDRSLVLAGEGFKIPDVQFVQEPSLPLNPYNYIEEDQPLLSLRLKEDRLDPDLRHARSEKPLIFHPEIAGFYNVPAGLPPVEKEPEPEVAVSPDPVRETHLWLSAGNGTELRLERHSLQWDLLKGNEAGVLREYYQANKPELTEKSESYTSKKPARTPQSKSR